MLYIKVNKNLEEITDKESCLQLQNKIEKIKVEKAIEGPPLLAPLDNISSQIFIETNFIAGLRDKEYMLYHNTSSLDVLKEEKNRLVMRKFLKKKEPLS